VIVGSTNGFQAEYDSSAYDTSKGALVMMTKSLALDLAKYSIRVNCLAPGLIRTPLTERWLDDNHAARAHYEKNIPLGRIGAIEDCGAATAFLTSEAASFITGHVLVVDGGLTLSQIDLP
jgi:NAD(P)-dependent dehydrogenase (short-subunit alcohol dehydrogenase family)